MPDTLRRVAMAYGAVQSIQRAKGVMMARSKYVYVLTWKDHVQSAAPLLTATVKREFLDALAELNGLDDTDAWRMGDGTPLDRAHLGSGAEMLARERPAPVAEGATSD